MAIVKAETLELALAKLTKKEQSAQFMASIAAFCTRWSVKEFALFGSILRDDFSLDSDVDVLISLAPGNKRSLFDLVQMNGELQALFERRVDLVQKEGLQNPFRRYEILRTHEVIYAAQ